MSDSLFCGGFFQTFAYVFPRLCTIREKHNSLPHAFGQQGQVHSVEAGIEEFGEISGGQFDLSLLQTHLQLVGQLQMMRNRVVVGEVRVVRIDHVQLKIIRQKLHHYVLK